MILESNGLASSRHGFVLTSIKYILNSSSIIKSNPKTSNVLIRLFGSIFPCTALNTSAVSLFIYGNMSLSKQIFRSPKYLSK
jgi:hypothetical protein